MKNAKIKELKAPSGDLAEFNPATFFAGHTFVETEDAITEQDRIGLADLLHYLTDVARHYQSSAWESCTVDTTSLAYTALENHFGHLEGWDRLASEQLRFKALMAFLANHYKAPAQMPFDT